MHTKANWQPSPASIAAANVTLLAQSLGIDTFERLHEWTVAHPADFWEKTVERLGIVFASPPQTILDITSGTDKPRWMVGATLNIVSSCFTARPDATAVKYTRDGGLHTLTYADLRRRVDEVANGLVAAGYGEGSRIAIAMPMTIESVYAYLAIVAIGGAVVSIADSFAADEIAVRLGITRTDAVITQDVIHRTGKQLPMYDKVVAAGAAHVILIETGAAMTLRDGDVAWTSILGNEAPFQPVVTDPSHHINMLFSSGTTGEPKAIPWSQLTPIKAAADGHYHQDIHEGDVVAWPTNLGWMMGPWLIFGSFINEATMALHDDAPTTESFVRFVEEASVSILGVVPSIVAAWRAHGLLDDVDLSAVRVLSSTGEASNADDMTWLMERTQAPVIEYCGGTEIGGGYISGTVVQPAVASTFSTPVLGIGMTILDEDGEETENGEVFLVPPSIGLSTELLNRDHAQVYYEGVPDYPVQLRRHGDQMERLANGYYRAHGRVDDTMNLGGIKVSSAEIERALEETPGVAELAAIAVAPPKGGPSQLVIYVVPQPGFDATDTWPDAMQHAIRTNLNPLFKIRDVVSVETLPRTASAKVMRRSLRSDYDDRQRSHAP